MAAVHKLYSKPHIIVYIVGGYVRDRLLGLDPKDHDFVVVGATIQDMLDSGFTQVGSDFPVFLNENDDEFALARTERKVSVGYNGFDTDHSNTITLQEDLYRRDLTINAMARMVIGWNSLSHAILNDEIIDPYEGQRDLTNKILNPVSEHFSEDPVRVLRAARFLSRYPEFSPSSKLTTIIADMKYSSELKHLVPERVNQELMNTLKEQKPSRFFNFLIECNVIQDIFDFDIFDIDTHLLFNVIDNHEISQSEKMVYLLFLIHESFNNHINRCKWATATYIKVSKLLSDNVDVLKSINTPTSNADNLLHVIYAFNLLKTKKLFSDVERLIPIILNDNGLAINLIRQSYVLIFDTGFDNLSSDQQKTCKGKEISQAIDEYRIKIIHNQICHNINRT